MRVLVCNAKLCISDNTFQCFIDGSWSIMGEARIGLYLVKEGR